MFRSILLAFFSSLIGLTAYAGDHVSQLEKVLAAQPDEVQARFPARHARETIEFFGLQPGMTVMEALPGGGWYSKILIPFLGNEGSLIGADYAEDMYPRFGFFAQDVLDSKKTWVTDWTAEASAWVAEGGASISAFQMGSMPDDMTGTADAVFFVRALHNLARFEADGAYLTKAVADAFNILKPGGVMGVVQHQARDEMPDDWASGSRGYLKQSFVIETMENAGFVLEASSDFNNNPADQPTTDDIVWRLPPTLATSGDNEELKAAMLAIGESNRMTLRFRKPE